MDGGVDCGPLPFPALLWEFQDPTDEDGSGAADLAESWSRPVVERIRICTANCGTNTAEIEDRWVAIFGGGLPEEPANSDADTAGNWLYMVDIETGEIVYKRGGVSRLSDTDSIVGAVPGDITTVDFNGNGYIETIYFGTTAGYLYKLSLGEDPFELGLDGRIADPAGEDGRYDPFQVFSTGGRPIYYEPTAVYVPKLRSLALAFGTGDRWDLWSFGGTEGRFYVIADLDWQDADLDGVIDSECGGCPQPLTESVYQAIDPDAAFDPLAPPPDYLLDTSDATPGWYLTLDADDRVITEAFSLSGVTVFTAYAPRQFEEDGACALGGESKIFVVGTTNAIGYARAAGSMARTRYTTAPTFTTSPFVEQSSTQNDPGSGGSGGGTQLCSTPELLQVQEELKDLYPPSCKFAFYTKNIETVRSDTGLICIAPVPVCIEQHNWKEF
jgi:Tfp pilus tip-associated adhesin PilY1